MSDSVREPQTQIEGRETMAERTSMVENVENIIVEALARQDDFARQREPQRATNTPKEPDSLEVTIAVIHEIADELDHEWHGYNKPSDWLRAQAKGENDG